VSTSEIPGGVLPLALAWSGGAALACAGIVFAIHGADVPFAGFAVAFGWGLVALLIGIALRVPRSPAVRLAGKIWLAVAIGGGAWLWWLQNV
jgi:hypothetical protein